MIKAIVASTREIDGADEAVAEILRSLDLKNNMLKNSIGIVSCFSEFDETGVAKAICDALPFDCIGSTSNISSTGKQSDQIIFAITVLTSDDCDFEAVAIPISENYEELIRSTLSPLVKEPNVKPAMLLTYLPLMSVAGNDLLIKAIDSTVGSVPLFGTAAMDHRVDYSTARTIYNGKFSNETIVLGLVRGAVECKFEVAFFSRDNIREQKAIITKSNDNVLISVNNMPALKYFESVGLKSDELKSGIVHIIVDHRDGTGAIPRGVIAFTPEDHMICLATMPVGATIEVGRSDRLSVLLETEKALKSLVAEEGSVILCYSCIMRYLALELNHITEAEKVIELVGDMQYMFSSSGGEICPLPDASGKLKNYYHNYSIVFCKLK